MKYKFSLPLLALMLMALVSCQKDFLEMPVSGATTVDSIFSTKAKSEGAIAGVYMSILVQGLATDDWNAMIQANISGELTYGYPWTPSIGIVTNGYTATGTNEEMAGFANNYVAIRQAFLVMENIDKVSDMTPQEKAIVKGEMKALIAYRYGQMLIIYGGVPLATRSYTTSEDLGLPRSPVKKVLDSVVSWCDQATAVLPSAWPAAQEGKMTKAAALAIKSKALLYAARPLFNTGTPYLDFTSNNNLICLGNNDPTRWNAAATAAQALITEAETAGGISIINTGNPLDDYGNATSLPSNVETILAYKFVYSWGMNTFYNPHNWQASINVLTTNHLEDYYKNDGTNQIWPGLTATTAFSDYTTKMNQMEARFKVSYMPFQMDSWSNPGNSYWSNTAIGTGPGYGAARSVKFYYMAGNRSWFEFPIFRLAAAYLSAAEALNEMGQSAEALIKLNKIHQRAGLPAVTVTDKDQLRTIIQREWAVEFHNENYRLHDVKHWKLQNIGNGILGGPIRGFAFNNSTSVAYTGNANYNDRVVYQAVWSPKQYLNPFPQTEINKGYIIQNPGY